MTEHDGAGARDAHEVADRPDEGPDDRQDVTADVIADISADVPAVTQAPGRSERAWAKDLWLSMSRRDVDALPRSARA